MLTLTEGRTLPAWIHKEAQWVPNKINTNRPTPRHVVIKRAKLKDKQKILKVAKEKQRVKHKGTSRSLSAYPFTEMLQVRRQYKDIFKVIKLKNLQPITLYPARLSFRTE